MWLESRIENSWLACLPILKFVQRSRSLWVINLVLEHSVCRCRPTWFTPQTQLDRSKMPCQAVVIQRGMRASQCLGVRDAVGSYNTIMGSARIDQSPRQDDTGTLSTLSAPGCDVLSLQINLLIDYSNSKDWHGLQTNISHLSSTKKLEHCNM